MNIRRTLTAALLAAAAVLPIGAAGVAAAPAASAATVSTSCNIPDHIPSRAEILVVEWYVEFLNIRKWDACENDGRFYWMDQLNAGVPREKVLGDIVYFGRGNDYNVAFVQSGYMNFFERQADPGAMYWVNGLNNGMAPEWFRQNLYASAEYASRSENQAAYVDKLYRQILGRGTTSEWETRYWGNRMNAVGRLNVVREIWYTTEGIDHRTTRNYSNVLNRKPSAGELAYWRPFEAASDDTFPIRIGAVREFENTYASSYQYGPDWR